jgi:hypothetical protein
MVPDRGPGGHRRVVAAALRHLTKARPLLFVTALAGCCGFLWFFLQPGEPNHPRYEGFEKQKSGYQPGGPGCDLSRLARLPIPSREAAEERERCREAAEDYRLQANDLIQQTRSADAAQSVVALTYEQSRIALAGLILGLLTLAAAGAAAFYARRAAIETERGADAAADAVKASTEGNRLNREAFIADQRPWLSVEATAAGPIVWKGNAVEMKFLFVIENVGRTPALNVRIDVELRVELGSGRLDEEQRRLADEARARPAYMGHTVFPGRRLEISYILEAGAAELANASAAMGGSDLILPHILGCASYYSAFAEGSHQTGFIYEILRRWPDGSHRLVGRSGGDVPADQLVFREWLRPGRID